MNWFRKSIALASFGGLGLLQSALAQDNGWRVATTAEPQPIAAAEPRRINLGKPSPLAANIVPISYSGLPRPTVVRAAREFQEGEPGNLFLPKELIPIGESKLPTIPVIKTLPTIQSVPPREPRFVPKIIDVDRAGKVAVIQEPEQLTNPPRRVVDRPIATSEPGIILDDGLILGDGNTSDFFESLAPRPNRFYATAEWLHWATNGYRIPTLATTSDPGVPVNNQGVLGLSTTRLLYGPDNVLSRMGPGARFTVGFQRDPCSCCWWEASYFYLAKLSENASFNSDSTPVIARPFFIINNGTQFRELTTTPGLLSGRLDINMSTDLWGAELNRRCFWYESDNWRISTLAGFRYLDLRDKLSITENLTALTALPPVLNAGDKAFVFDRFDTRNQFYGGQIGLNAEWRNGRWSVDTRLKIALGATKQTIDVEGTQRVIKPASVKNEIGGLYALSSNIGTQAQTRLSFVPEVGVKVGYDLTDNVRVFVGYDFMYWSSVVRPGDQIDPSLDTNILPNSGLVQPAAKEVRPRVPFQRSNFWAQGVNAGFELRY